MKYFNYLLLSATLCNGCMITPSFHVNQDYKESFYLNQYRTYTFFTDLDNSYPSTVNNLLKVAIANRMKMFGLVYDEQSPDIMISYSIHENKMVLKGYTQPLRDKEIMEKDNTCQQVDHKLKKGTILIQITDLSSMECIWQGYTVTASDPNILKNDHLMKYTTYEIMEQCRVFTLTPDFPSKYIATH